MRAPAGSTHFMPRIRILLIYFGYLGDEGTSRLHPLYVYWFILVTKVMRAPAGSTHFMPRIRILLIYFGYLGDEGTSRLHPLYAQNQDFIDFSLLPRWWGH